MIEIQYCGSCGDFDLIKKLEDEILEETGLEMSDVTLVECGNCDLQVFSSGEMVFSEEEQLFDIGRIVEKVKQKLQA
jgi:hypothetical protein